MNKIVSDNIVFFSNTLADHDYLTRQQNRVPARKDILNSLVAYAPNYLLCWVKKLFSEMAQKKQYIRSFLSYIPEFN